MSWQRVRGHDRWIRAFEQVARRGRLAHAYLFVGPPGIGKRLFAAELAKVLLCEGRAADSFAGCDACPACTQVEAGTHPDYFTAVRPPESQEFPIDVVRELCRGLSLKPARGKGKFAVVDDADDLNEEAANCFLKTLEEPPPGAILILIGTSEDRQLATIVSRCQVIRFRPLPDALVAELLHARGVADGKLIERLVGLSEGSPGRAQALADPALWDFRGSLVQGLSQPRPDAVGLAQQWLRFAEEAGKETSSHRRRAALTLGLLIECLKDALLVSLGKTPKLTDPGDLALLQNLARGKDPERLLEVIDRCLEADYHIERNVQLALVIESLVHSFADKMAWKQP